MIGAGNLRRRRLIFDHVKKGIAADRKEENGNGSNNMPDKMAAATIAGAFLEHVKKSASAAPEERQLMQIEAVLTQIMAELATLKEASGQPHGLAYLHQIRLASAKVLENLLAKLLDQLHQVSFDLSGLLEELKEMNHELLGVSSTLGNYSTSAVEELRSMEAKVATSRFDGLCSSLSYFVRRLRTISRKQRPVSAGREGPASANSWSATGQKLQRMLTAAEGLDEESGMSLAEGPSALSPTEQKNISRSPNERRRFVKATSTAWTGVEEQSDHDFSRQQTLSTRSQTPAPAQEKQDELVEYDDNPLSDKFTYSWERRPREDDPRYTHGPKEEDNAPREIIKACHGGRQMQRRYRWIEHLDAPKKDPDALKRKVKKAILSARRPAQSASLQDKGFATPSQLRSATPLPGGEPELTGPATLEGVLSWRAKHGHRASAVHSPWLAESWKRYEHVAAPGETWFCDCCECRGEKQWQPVRPQQSVRPFSR
eukprot:TRINITY_DN69304_c0_g1_i1.p1 TRINITY_DN69304_c0_g1~~TRINITY_DN69304_c0_g1_i1.p1  ORF type:complete len:486 (-),score=77.93 TRINITY_DN69304_c0_g1_i1:133-1590(-)